MLVSRSSSTCSNSSLIHPSISQTYVRSGIGGAGNYLKATEVPSAPPVPQIIAPRHGSFSSGVGGAGNIHSSSKRPVLCPKEEVAREQAIKRNVRPAYHVGIGGAGNYIQKATPAIIIEPSSIYSSEPLSNSFDEARRRLSEVFASFSLSRRPSVDDSSDIVSKLL